MQFTGLAIAAILGLAAAAPAAPENKDMMTKGKWSLEKFTRTCDKADNQCKFSYNIVTGKGAGTKCEYTINAKDAKHAGYDNVHCGEFIISSGWNGQFGKDNGFTVLAVTNKKHIAFPAYTDKQLCDGKAVAPNQAYVPQNLPM